MKFFYFLFILLIPTTIHADLLKPSPSYSPEKVISIQLNALKFNNVPYENAGIEQTWEFAHPNNRIYTGPLKNFINLIYSDNYSIMLNHQEHKIIKVKKNDNTSFFFIEIIDMNGIKFGFQWTVEKVILEGLFNDCWMTIGVSKPMKISESA